MLNNYIVFGSVIKWNEYSGIFEHFSFTGISISVMGEILMKFGLFFSNIYCIVKYYVSDTFDSDY